MIHREEFWDRFISDQPFANPHTLAGNMGEDLPAEDWLKAWQKANEGNIEITSVTEKDNGDIVVFFEVIEGKAAVSKAGMR